MEVLNPAGRAQRLRVVPPARPFYISVVSVLVMPGQRQRIDIFFEPDGYGQTASDIVFRTETADLRLLVVARNQGVSFALRNLVIDNDPAR